MKINIFQVYGGGPADCASFSSLFNVSEHIKEEVLSPCSPLELLTQPTQAAIPKFH